MPIQLSADGLWIITDQYVNEPDGIRSSILKSTVRAAIETPWLNFDFDGNPILNSDGNPIGISQVQTGQQQINLFATFDEVVAVLDPDSTWITGQQFIGWRQSCRFAVDPNRVDTFYEAPWNNADLDGNPITVTNIVHGQFPLNALMAYDDVAAILTPAPPVTP